MESPSNFLKSLRWKPSTAVNRSEEHVGGRWGRNSVIRWYMTFLSLPIFLHPSVANNFAWSPSLFSSNKCYSAGVSSQTPLFDGTSDQKLFYPFLMYKNVHAT